MGGGIGGAFAEIDEGGSAVGEANQHETAAAEVARGGMGDGEGHGDSDRGVNGVSASLERGDTGIGGVGFARDDHGVTGMDGLASFEGWRDPDQCRCSEQGYGERRAGISHI